MVAPAIRTEADRDPEFARWIREVEGAETIEQCIHCGVCSGSCPLSTYMDRGPRQVMHLAREGFREDVLSSFSIWLCTSCYACSVKCPREIKVTDIMYALKRRAIEEGVYPKRFPIPVLAREFKKMVLRNGRISESRLAVQMMLKTNALRLLGMAGHGRKLLSARRLHLKTEKVKGRAELARMLAAVEKNNKEAA